MKYPGVQEGAYLDFQKVISLKPKEIPPEYTTPGGSLIKTTKSEKSLKMLDFQRFYFFTVGDTRRTVSLANPCFNLVGLCGETESCFPVKIGIAFLQGCIRFRHRAFIGGTERIQNFTLELFMVVIK